MKSLVKYIVCHPFFYGFIHWLTGDVDGTGLI